MTKEEYLLDTINYYNGYYEERSCRNPSGSCYYDPKSVGKEGKSEGCAIGRKLRPKVKEYLDKNYGGWFINRIIEAKPEGIPQWMYNIDGKFLKAIQELHDLGIYWKEDYLSTDGKKYINRLIITYKLSIPEMIF